MSDDSVESPGRSLSLVLSAGCLPCAEAGAPQAAYEPEWTPGSPCGMNVKVSDSFEVITQIFRLQQAQEWQATLQYQFIWTHWILPYPSKQSFWSWSTVASGRDQQCKLQTWASVHPWVLSYYQEHPPAHDGLAT
ncbi:hypothetical protein AJ79_10199, partial [Helicocarpus griseus UAMH5409]